jgi:16S rRNA (guanine1207-N2)-methyltransferase
VPSSDLIVETVRGLELRLQTQAGVFAHRGLDGGTRLLIESMHITPTNRVLDLGCGYGAIGIAAAKIATRGEVVLVDSDIRATRLAQRNIELNGVTNAGVVLGDGVHDLPPKSRFDLVVSNPPTHSGREVLEDFVAGAYAVLKPRGRLYLVLNRVLSLRREVEEVFGNAETVARSKGFVVIRAQKHQRRPENDELLEQLYASPLDSAEPRSPLTRKLLA